MTDAAPVREPHVSSSWVWADGHLVPFDDAVVHVGDSFVHFGPVAFEGIRVYSVAERRHVFRLGDHVQRLARSAQTVGLEPAWTAAELEAACAQLLRAYDAGDAYLRPVVLPGRAGMGFGRRSGPARTFVVSMRWNNAALARAQRRGISAHVARTRRVAGSPELGSSKLSANYAAGLVALREAHQAGCDEAILLDAEGTVAEASTANIFVVLRGCVVTPPLTLPILPGITRACVFELAASAGLCVEERRVHIAELFEAEEVFLTGTTCEILPVASIDGYGTRETAPGPVTVDLLTRLHDMIRSGGSARDWTFINKGSPDADSA